MAFATSGYIVSWGTFQAYYEANTLRDHSPSAIAWIGSLQYSLLFLPGAVTGYVFDRGYFQSSLVCSSIVYVTSSFLIAECRRYWQFLLCQGLALGVSTGWIVVPCTAVIAQWFRARRPIALSVVSSGSSVGGIVFPIVLRQLLPMLGFRWTIRAIALINLVCIIIANLALRTRMTPGSRSMTCFRALAQPPYILYTLSTFLSFLGLYTLMTFLSVSAEAIGINSALAFYLVSVANAASGLGRVLSGALAVRFGALNVMIVCTALAGAMTYVWPFIHSQDGFIAVVWLYGVSSGAFVCLFSVVALNLGSSDDAVGLRTGVQMSVMALGALAGPPISGAIQKHTGSFHHVGIYAGSMIMASIVVMILARWAHVGKIVGGAF
ncbi:MFS general substrate transporter [Phanerochaete sordida]|uniref:MFS general substrate transporter n=1 Tax=Phanerochaete sordida TaxID=48140 RepID=A0A9P3GBA7_9APHY|nr:MFS general substrate transporter [Phanerochaete sordida]